MYLASGKGPGDSGNYDSCMALPDTQFCFIFVGCESLRLPLWPVVCPLSLRPQTYIVSLELVFMRDAVCPSSPHSG